MLPIGTLVFSRGWGMGLVMGCKICTHRRKRPHLTTTLTCQTTKPPILVVCNVRCSSLAAAAAATFSFLQSYDGSSILVASPPPSLASKNRCVLVRVRTYMNLGGLQQRDATVISLEGQPTLSSRRVGERPCRRRVVASLSPATPLALRCFMLSCLCPAAAASSSALWRLSSAFVTDYAPRASHHHLLTDT